MDETIIPKVEVRKGSIVNLQVDAIVNPASPSLLGLERREEGVEGLLLASHHRRGARRLDEGQAIRSFHHRAQEAPALLRGRRSQCARDRGGVCRARTRSA